MTDLMPIIRVRRKRSADPHAALIMETKKRKEDPLLFSFFKTESASENLDAIQGARVIEFKAEYTDEAEGQGLEFVGEHNDIVAGPSVPNDDRMEDVVDDENDAVRYDYYKIYRGSISEPIKQWDSEDIELRFATEAEQTLLLGNSDSESDCAADDDDDSNDENNWRNDYPEDEDDGNDETDDEHLHSYDEDDQGYSIEIRDGIIPGYGVYPLQNPPYALFEPTFTDPLGNRIGDVFDQVIWGPDHDALLQNRIGDVFEQVIRGPDHYYAQNSDDAGWAGYVSNYEEYPPPVVRDNGELNESPFALERMRRRLERFEMGIYEGEEDVSDDDYNRDESSSRNSSNPDYGEYDYRYRED
ncbi:hypothetical protein Q1695_005887 [Nippostrongylus brasiliensis]|nr:hypothetical protein Q1695_005887 [Nippostrongylus brasiliensis]